jgi:hypothetical protein
VIVTGTGASFCLYTVILAQPDPAQCMFVTHEILVSLDGNAVFVSPDLVLVTVIAADLSIVIVWQVLPLDILAMIESH